MTLQDTTAAAEQPAPRRPHPASGLAIALLSAIAFATSGPFGASLLAVGWSPGAVVSMRLVLATLVLLPLALRAARGRWRAIARAWPLVVAYGALATAGCQYFYFAAVERLSVSVALLLEYSSPVLIVLGGWIITRRRPGALTLLGTVAAMTGLALVLDVLQGFRVDPVGVGLGLLAALGSAAYFVIGAHAHDDLPPLVLATGGLGVGGVLLLVLGGVGLLPLTVGGDTVELAGLSTSWLVPAIGISVIAGSVAYATGIAASRRLGSRLASFTGLSEVLFAILLAWLLVGDRPGPVQLVGAAVIVTGLALVKWDELRSAERDGAQPTSK